MAPFFVDKKRNIHSVEIRAIHGSGAIKVQHGVELVNRDMSGSAGKMFNVVVYIFTVVYLQNKFA